jgi:ketosteroid isomerase-like protein
MKNLIISLLLCFPFAVSAGQADTPKDSIRQVLDAQVRAWNKGDLPAFMEGYWNSPDLSFFSGNNKTAGWQATLERYQKKYQGEKKEMGQLTFKELSIDLLGSDHALVKGRFQLQMKNETPTGIFTLILKKVPTGWRIIHDHTSN